MVSELTHFVHGKNVPGRAETEAVIADAEQAQVEWGSWSPQRRARVLLKFLHLVEPEREAIARTLSAEHGKTVADRALQLHGGYGYLTEYGIEKIVRDLRVHRILEGTNEIMSLIIARRLTGAA